MILSSYESDGEHCEAATRTLCFNIYIQYIKVFCDKEACWKYVT